MDDALPYLTPALPGTDGVLRQTEDDFEVEEIPAYEPCGEGDHVYAWIEKRGVTTFQAVDRMAHALGVSPRDVGTAGLKDRHAVTRQLVSFPPPTAPEAVAALALDGVRVLEVRRHRNKLKTGHLRGNRFRITVREVGADALARARAIVAELQRPPGSPNWFGEQRFGARGDNADVGRALVLGEKPPGRPPRGKQRRLFISAFQSQLFNDYVRRRIADGSYHRALTGEVMRGGEPAGPIFGHELRLPPADTEAGVLERAVLADAGISLADFERVGKLARGTRRPIGVSLGDASVEALPDGAIRVAFELPAGAYATAVLREITKTS